MAGNRIKIRRGSGKPSDLLGYELGWDYTNKILYINDNGNLVEILQAANKGKSLVSGDNVDTLLPGIYYSSSSTNAAALNGTKPNGDNSGFRLEVINGYGTNYGAQIAYDSSSSIKIRKNPVYHNPALTYSDFTGIPWQVILTSANVGSYTTVSNTWTAGSTAGPTIKTTVNGINGTAVAIPSASTTTSGIITTSTQSFAGAKTFTADITVSKTGEPALIVNNTEDHKVGLIIGSSSKNGGLWDYTNGKWIVYSTTAGAVTLNGNATNATTAVDTTYDDTCTVSAGNSNEVNFGGTNTSTTIYFGYRARGSRPQPNTYIFGSSNNGTATIKADKVYGAGCVCIRDSGTTARKIWTTTSASVPSGAVAGDIVLVKA